MEQLRDSYASDSLAQLARSLGFNGEPAHIDAASNRNDYTLSIIQKWLGSNDIFVYCVPNFDDENWLCRARLRLARAVETAFGSSYDDALEAGLRTGCMLLKEKQDASKVLD